MANMNDLVAQTSGKLPDRISAMGQPSDANDDLVAQLVQVQSQQSQLAGQKAALPTLGDQLTSLPGLIAALSAAGGVASGNQQAADAGLGMLGGFMQQSQAQTAADEATIASAQAQTQKMLDANRQRLSTMITSRPELFIDPDTGKSTIDPRLLGYASTGFMLPIDPGAAYSLNKQTSTQKTAVQLGTNLILNGDTPEKRRQGGVIVKNALGLDLSDDFFDAIAQQDETGRWSTLLSNDNIDPKATLSAWTFSTQNGRQLADPEVIGMLRASKKGASGKYTINDRTLDLVGEFTKIMGQADGALQNEPLSDQIDFAFSGREGDIALMKKHFMGNDAFGTGISGNQALNMLQSTGQMLTMMFMMAPDSTFLKNMGINNPEDIWKVTGRLSDSAIAYTQEALSAEASQNVGFKIRQLADLMKESDPNLTFGDASNNAIVQIMQLKEKHTTATGQFDLKAFNAAYGKLVTGE